MLVLSRQRDEIIMIGDHIEVSVVDIRGDKVRLGITAPKEVSVHRKEVYDAIRRENRAAAQVKPGDLPALKVVEITLPPAQAVAVWNQSNPVGVGVSFPEGTGVTHTRTRSEAFVSPLREAVVYVVGRKHPRRLAELTLTPAQEPAVP